MIDILADVEACYSVIAPVFSMSLKWIHGHLTSLISIGYEDRYPSMQSEWIFLKPTLIKTDTLGRALASQVFPPSQQYGASNDDRRAQQAGADGKLVEKHKII